MSDGTRGDVLELECRSLAQRLFLLAELELEPLPQDEVVRQLQGLPDVRRQFRQAYTEWRERGSAARRPVTGPIKPWPSERDSPGDAGEPLLSAHGVICGRLVS